MKTLALFMLLAVGFLAVLGALSLSLDNHELRIRRHSELLEHVLEHLSQEGV